MASRTLGTLFHHLPRERCRGIIAEPYADSVGNCVLTIAAKTDKNGIVELGCVKLAPYEVGILRDLLEPFTLERRRIRSGLTRFSR